MKQMYKKTEKQILVVVGHLNDEEIQMYKRKGYSSEYPRKKYKHYNKHGIPIERVECR